MIIRCKFQVLKVADLAWKATGGKYAQEITLGAVYSENAKTAEDINFAASTPTGILTFTVTNPDVIGTLNPGAFYYLDLEPVAE